MKATKANHEISTVVSSCTYGAETSLAALAKDVVLSLEVTSRPLTGADLQYSLSQAEKLKMKFTPYSGLGMVAYYYTFTQSGITTQGMIAHCRYDRLRGGYLHQDPSSLEACRPCEIDRETLSLWVCTFVRRRSTPPTRRLGRACVRCRRRWSKSAGTVCLRDAV